MSPQALTTTQTNSGVDSFIKPGELIDVVELTPLTLQDRRIYNLLLANAWDSIEEDKTHVIAKKELRGSHNVNDRIGESIERLMGAIVKVKTVEEGEAVLLRMQLLAPNREYQRADGKLLYRFPQELQKVIKESRIFARLQKTIMYSFKSKYSLALYEIVQKRGNLKYKSFDDFALDEFRGLLGVPVDKLQGFRNFNAWAIKPALKEVNFLSEYEVKIEPQKKGRTVVGVRLSWQPKNAAQMSLVSRELDYSKVGRGVRAAESGEDIAIVDDESIKHKIAQHAQQEKILIESITMEKAKELARNAGTGWDIYAIEKQFLDYIEKKGRPDNPQAAFIGFVKQKVVQRP